MKKLKIDFYQDFEVLKFRIETREEMWLRKKCEAELLRLQPYEYGLIDCEGKMTDDLTENVLQIEVVDLIR